MKFSRYVSRVLVFAAMAVSFTVHAQSVSGQGTWETTLLGRDINLNAVSATDASAVYLYDTKLNVTWLRNTNVNGLMTWSDATTWVTDLVTGGGAAAISDWRLPTTVEAKKPVICTSCVTNGYGRKASSSEMANLYFSTLRNKSSMDDMGIEDQWGGGLTNTGSLQYLEPGYYWSGTTTTTEYASNPTSFSWAFNFGNGYQGYVNKDTQFYALAVRPGDVSPAPEPETYAMLLAGLGLIGAVTRRRRLGNLVKTS